MRTWFGSILFVVLATFAVASGCGSKPDVINHGNDLDASVGGASGSSTGTAANGGALVIIGDGGAAGTGDGNGCPSKCEDLNANCGFVEDTICGGKLVQCGKTCPDGQFCGGDGPSRCGDGSGGAGGACSGPGCMNCVPRTCADIGYTCGLTSDNCGNVLDCGSNTCAVPGQTCGGGGKLGQCGCKGACATIPDCSAEDVKTTSLTGKVYDPAGNNPLYHVFVYIANNPSDPNLKDFPAGISCDVCGATAAGSPLLTEGTQAGTYTDVDGSFTLKNVPVGKGLTLVIQLGRWRPCSRSTSTHRAPRHQS